VIETRDCVYRIDSIRVGTGSVARVPQTSSLRRAAADPPVKDRT